MTNSEILTQAEAIVNLGNIGEEGKQHDAIEGLRLMIEGDGVSSFLCSDGLGRFFQTFEALQKDVHQNARDKGFWDTERNDGELLALMHSELSEALEALRAGNPPDDKVPAFSGVTVELADVVIRIMDYAEARGFSVAGAIVAKMEFNKTREHMHGGKRF